MEDGNWSERVNSDCPEVNKQAIKYDKYRLDSSSFRSLLLGATIPVIPLRSSPDIIPKDYHQHFFLVGF